MASSLDSDILKENIASYCEKYNSEFVKMARVEYLIRVSSTKLPVNDIIALFKGKERLSEISQRILKDNIYRYLTSYQYDVKIDRWCALIWASTRKSFDTRAEIGYVKKLTTLGST